MNEDKILNKTIEMLSDSIAIAYEYLLEHDYPAKSSQYYNFLYCLASLLEKENDALAWLEEAIIDKGFWYRSEVFEDDDLDFIRESERFKRCVSISDGMYKEALVHTKILSTWETVEQDNLLLALHGNQQNNKITRSHWSVFTDVLQVEYLQSSTLDSQGLYRWDPDYGVQLGKTTESIELDQYKKTILVGFSAGCNQILEAVTHQGVRSDVVILVSPWLPILEKHLKQVQEYLSTIQVYIICGTRDDDCRPHVEKLVQDFDVVQVKWIEGIEHEFPISFESIVREILNKELN